MDIQNREIEVSDKKYVGDLPRSPLIPTTVKEAYELATILSKSSIVPQGFSGKPESVFICISFGMELGLPPLQALQNIYVVNNKPTIYGDAALALASEYPLVERIDEDAPDIALKNGTGRCAIKLKSGQVIERRFSVEDAKKAGLWGKSGPWTQYTGRMLMYRARAWAIRDAVPGCLKGMQVREEVEDFQVKKPLQMPQEIKTVEPVVVETPADRIAKARAAFAEKYQATDEEMDALMSKLIAESDGNLSEEELPDALTGLWNDLRQGKAAPDVVFNRIGIAKEKKK